MSDMIITTTLAKCQATRMPQKSNILRTIEKSKKKCHGVYLV